MLQFILILWGVGTLAAGLLLWASLYVSSRAEENEQAENRFEVGRLEGRLDKAASTASHARL